MKITIKETGIVRRVDDLGRVIIPKELRRKTNIKPNDLMELLIVDNGISAGITILPYYEGIEQISTALKLLESAIHNYTINNSDIKIGEKMLSQLEQITETFKEITSDN